MMRRLFYFLTFFSLLSPLSARATEVDYDALIEMAETVTSSDFLFIFDLSEADGSRMKKLSMTGTATDVLNGAGGWADLTNYETAWGTVTVRDDDATPLVADHGIYSLTSPNNADCAASTDPYACCTGSGTGTCTGALTVTNFVDADGDHTDFVAGDQIILILSDADITLDCSENANLECFAGNDFTASASQITASLFVFDGTRWVGPSMPMSSPTSLALAGIQSSTPVVGDPDNVTFTTAGTNLYGGKFIANAAGTYAHSGAIAVGENWAIEAQSAAAVAVTINAADTIMLNGTSCTQGVGLTSDSTVAAFVACQYQAASTITCRGASFTCTP